jgi:hypothetical protein
LRRVVERLRSNLGLKALSLAIAVAAWAYLRLTPNPVIAARFEQQISVPIATTGLRADEIARFSERQALVAIDVPHGGTTIRPEMVRAVLSLEGRGPGVYNVPVEVIAPKLEIKSLSPASVTLAIERVEARTLPVALHYLGAKNVVVQSAAVEPADVTLRGPTSDLQRVATVRVDLTLPSAPSGLDVMLRPVAIDARGAEVAGISVSPNLARVRARFDPAQHAKL